MSNRFGIVSALILGICQVQAIPPDLALAPDEKAKAPSEILTRASAQFGSPDLNDEGELTIREASHFANIVGESYGWIVDLTDVRGKVVVKEYFTLPAKAEWGLGGDPGKRVLVAEGAHAETEHMVAAEAKGQDRIVFGGWDVAEGDPDGRYEIDLFLNGERFKHFDFVVGDLSKDPRFPLWEKERQQRIEAMWKKATDQDLARWFQDPEQCEEDWEIKHQVRVPPGKIRDFLMGKMRERQMLVQGLSRVKIKALLGKAESDNESSEHFSITRVSNLWVSYDEDGLTSRFELRHDHGGEQHNVSW